MKIRHQGNVKHRDGNGRPRKTPANINLSIGQWIRRNIEITVKNSAETRATLWFEYVRIDNATSSSSDGL